MDGGLAPAKAMLLGDDLTGNSHESSGPPLFASWPSERGTARHACTADANAPLSRSPRPAPSGWVTVRN